MGDAREHADHVDPLEAELASFRAPPVSLELRERIGAELSRRPSPVRAVIGPLAGLAAAACVVAGVAIWAQRATTTKHAGGPDRGPSDHNIPTHRAAVGFASPPTVMDYRRAFAESPDALDALLARPAGREGRAEPRTGDSAVTAFDRSTSNLTKNGESL